jgi:hypothetical protein
VRQLLWLLLAATVLPASAQGQRPAPSRTKLRAGVDSLFIYAIRGTDTTATGRVRDELQVRRVGAEEHLVRVYASTDAILGTRLDTIIDRQSDLDPRYHHSQSSSGSELIRFVGSEAKGYARLASGDSVRIQATMPAGAINGASFDLFLRSSDLQVGQTLIATGFEASGRAIVSLEARIAGEDQVSGEPCWRAEAVFGGMAVHFWIGKSSRRLHQQVMFIRPDFQILFRSTPSAREAPGRRAA